MLKSMINILTIYFLPYFYGFLLPYFEVLAPFKLIPFIIINSYLIIGLILYYICKKKNFYKNIMLNLISCLLVFVVSLILSSTDLIVIKQAKILTIVGWFIAFSIVRFTNG